MVGGEGADVDALADGRGQRLDLVEAAVQLVQGRQPGPERSRRRVRTRNAASESRDIKAGGILQRCMTVAPWSGADLRETD